MPGKSPGGYPHNRLGILNIDGSRLLAEVPDEV
jgi:hypothetical protein